MSVVYTDNLFKNKKILYAVVDQAKVASQHVDLYKKMRDITYSLTTRLTMTTSGDVKYFDDIDQAMLASDNYDLVFIQSVGNFIKSNEILMHFENYCNTNPNFFIVAFTLDWQSECQTGWVECHHQMMLINVHTWKQIGSPQYGNWETKTEALPTYSRSAENFHDNYTPYWMRGEPGTSIKTRTKQGWGFIKAAFAHGITVDNFTKAMRECRLYVYPEHESSTLYDAYIKKDHTIVTNSNQKRWIKSLNLKPQIWVYNSERYNFILKNKECSTYFGPAAGFKYLDVLNGNGKVKFVFYDFHQKSLDWIKELKETWNGDNFPEYLEKKSPAFSKYYKFVNNSIDNNQTLLFHDFGGEDKFKILWHRFKLCEAEFVLCDLFDADQLNTLLNHTVDNTPFFYYSNIFATDYTLANLTLDEAKIQYEQFLTTIFNRYPNAIAHGCNELGIWIDTYPGKTND